jgi:hypothetical protein
MGRKRSGCCAHMMLAAGLALSEGLWPRPPTVPNRKSYNPLMDTMMDQFSQLNDERRANVTALGTDKAKWQARQQATAEHLAELFGPLDLGGVPPNYTVTGSLKREGFTMHKILYQTRPGLFVTGSLWVPDGADTLGGTKKYPGVLLVSGHTSDAWRNNGRTLGDCTGPLDNCTGPDQNGGGGGAKHPHGPKSPLGPFKGNPGGYQLTCWNLVHKGFVVLAYDPIGQGERDEYVRPGEVASKGHNWGTFEHEYLARQLFLSGRSAASFWVHDEMRSTDLLAGLPYVDAENLGVCGCSGGGTQASYLGAVDKRIKAASIACYMSTFETDYNYNYGGEVRTLSMWRPPSPASSFLTVKEAFRGFTVSCSNLRSVLSVLWGGGVCSTMASRRGRWRRRCRSTSLIWWKCAHPSRRRSFSPLKTTAFLSRVGSAPQRRPRQRSTPREARRTWTCTSRCIITAGATETARRCTWLLPWLPDAWHASIAVTLD